VFEKMQTIILPQQRKSSVTTGVKRLPYRTGTAIHPVSRRRWPPIAGASSGYLLCEPAAIEFREEPLPAMSPLSTSDDHPHRPITETQLKQSKPGSLRLKVALTREREAISIRLGIP
jgi:hypothetical protein